MPGSIVAVVVVEGIWPNRNFASALGINALTSADPGWPKGGAVFHDTAVWLRADVEQAPACRQRKAER